MSPLIAGFHRTSIWTSTSSIRFCCCPPYHCWLASIISTDCGNPKLHNQRARKMLHYNPHHEISMSHVPFLRFFVQVITSRGIPCFDNYHQMINIERVDTNRAWHPLLVNTRLLGYLATCERWSILEHVDIDSHMLHFLTSSYRICICRVKCSSSSDTIWNAWGSGKSFSKMFLQILETDAFGGESVVIVTS